MPIIGHVGRKSLKMRILNISIHVILIIGSVTMIYPFLLMLSSSFKSHLDSNEFSVIPRFFYNEEALFQKYCESHLNEESNRLTDQLGNAFISFDTVRIPEKPSVRRWEDWNKYLSETSTNHTIYDFYISEQYGRGIYSSSQREFRNLMKKKAHNNLNTLNHLLGMHFIVWDDVQIEEKEIFSRNFSSGDQGIMGENNKFKLSLPFYKREYINLDGNFISQELIPLFQNDLRKLNDSLNTNFNTWSEIQLNETVPEGKLRDFWLHYVKKILNIHFIGLRDAELPFYRQYLKNKYNNVDLLNQTYHSRFKDFQDVVVPNPLPYSGAVVEDLTFYVEAYAHPENLFVRSVDHDYKKWLENRYGDINHLLIEWKPGYADFSELSLPEKYPEDNIRYQNDWTDFVKTRINPENIEISPTAQTDYLEFLKTKVGEENGELNLAGYNQRFAKNEIQAIDIYPPVRNCRNAEERKIREEFIKSAVHGRFISVKHNNSDIEWQNYLKNKYGQIDRLNQSYSLIPQSFNQVRVNHTELIYLNFKIHRKAILKEFLTRNYIMVLDLMMYNGRAIQNTLIYCLLSILTALIVNPLAAYALSRFKPRFTYQLIMLFMLTMAFPAMVMGIPNFIILKKMNMLNTFWALVLPAAADGYFIFLLKGFFDSLPKEIIESATLDGVSEGRLFWQFVMSLSKPILAVIALGAFNAAYRNFMFAFIVCQNQDMWTLMVHIYNLIQRSAAGVGYASLVVAAIPTLLVFVFFQNMIIRAIVVPTEK